MGSRRLSFLLAAVFGVSLAACGDNKHPAVLEDGGIDSVIDARVDAPPDVLTCTGAGEMVCGGTCVNTNTSNEHCGACDTPCAGTCQNGVCCPSGQTNCNGTCVDLTSDEAHCGTCTTTCDTSNGETCQTDNGVTTCCPSGQTNCNGTCVDLQTDEAHCGACSGAGTSCTGATDTCCGGTCIDDTVDNNNCGACGTMCTGGDACEAATPSGAPQCCAASETNCSGSCVDTTTDNANCGTCGMTCNTGAGQSCTAPDSGAGYACCTATQNNCNGTCSDPQTDVNNCGACGNACGTGETCNQGVCCGPGETVCGSVCVDLQSDPNNCGACGPGSACSGGTPVCSGGQCEASCPSGETNCNNACVNTDSDHEHCGGCNLPCAGNQVCNNGVCATTCTGAGETVCAGDCVNLQTDENNCGTCGNTCPASGDPANFTQCVAGDCQPDCGAGTLYCGGTSCIDPANDEANCGGCGVACAPTYTCDDSICCAPGKENVGGICCDIGFINCGNQCFDPASSEAHCGNCATSCPVGQTCNAANPTSDSKCCPNNQILCNGVCIDPLTDGDHCGGCFGSGGDDCTAGVEQCAGGMCCGIGDPGDPNDDEIRCGNTCVDPMNDPVNCGGCAPANTCGGGEVCVGGFCTTTCPYPSNTCGPGGTNLCTDLDTDEQHCGSCTNVCAVGQTCSGGVCGACPVNAPTVCNNECVDTTTDENNCGVGAAGCNVFCDPGESCSNSTCCTAPEVGCNGACVDFLTGTPGPGGTTLNCGGCGAPFTCAAGSVCVNGSCECGFGQQACPNGPSGCHATAVDAEACGPDCTDCADGEYCVSGGCVTSCPAPLTACGAANDPNRKCTNTQSDTENCGGCGAAFKCADGFGCSGGLCVPELVPDQTLPKCIGGGPPIVVPVGGQQVCTGNLGAVAFTFGVCSRTRIGPLSRDLFTDAFDSTSGPYVASCTDGVHSTCGPLRCRQTDVECSGPANTVADCTGGSGDICEYRVLCVAGTCVAGGIGVNGVSEVSWLADGAACANDKDDDLDGVVNDGCFAVGAAETQCNDVLDNDTDGSINDGCPDVIPLGDNSSETASNTANTHVGGDFWVFGVTGLAMKGDTQVKQRFFNQGQIDVAGTSRVWGVSLATGPKADVRGPWASGGNPDMTIDPTLYTALGSCSPQPLPANDLTLNGTPKCVNAAFSQGRPPCGEATDVVPVQAIVKHFSDPAYNDNDALSPPLDPAILTAPTLPVRIDLPCGYYYFDQMNIGKDTTIVVHGRTAIFVGGAVRVSQKLIFDLQPTATLDIFVGGAVNVSNVVTLGSPAYPRLSRLWVGGTGCTGTGACGELYDCCSGVCDANGQCGAGGGGNLTQAISLSNGGFFNGLLYAGRGEFTHSNPLEMYGAIFANYLDASGVTTVHYDRGAIQAFEECGEDPPSGSCESCFDCANQACVNNQCGQCTSDSQCCPPLTCDVGTGTCR